MIAGGTYMRFAVSALRYALLLSCGSLVATPLAAQVRSAPTIQFDIPSQDLATALAALARQSGREIVVSADVARDVRTNGLRATITFDDAVRRLLAGSGLTFRTLASGVVIIEQPSVGSPETEEAAEILVVGRPITGSQQAALQQQRAADNVVNVLSSDAMGQFPDQSAAAALSRAPGVATQRDQGQERYIQVRGAPNRWTNVTVDGIVVSGSDEDGVSRSFRFDAIPAAILSALEINKSITPDLPGDAIVAQVNLRTVSPFDREGLAGQLVAGLGTFELGGGLQSQFSGRLSWSGDRVGVIAAASRYERNQITDNREFAYDADGLPTVFDFRTYRLKRTNTAGLLGAEFRPNDDHRLFVKGIYTAYADDEARNQYVFDVDGAADGMRTADAGDLVGVPVTGGYTYGRLETSNRIAQIGGDHDMGSWEAAWRLGFVKSQTESYILGSTNLINDPLRRPSFRYDSRNRNFPILDLATTAAGSTPGSYLRGEERAVFDAAAFDFGLLVPLRTQVDSEAWIGKIDLTKDLELGSLPVQLRLGGQYEDRTIDGWVATYGNIVMASALLPQIGGRFVPADFNSGESWTTDFPSGTRFDYIDAKRMYPAMEETLGALQDAGLYDPALDVAAADRFAISERLYAGYASIGLTAGDLSLVAGARIEHLDQRIGGFLVGAEGTTPLTVETARTHIFPSINAKVELQRDLIFRVAAQSGIARPSFGTIRSGVRVDDLGRTITGGNPLLTPERTYGADASLERYIGSAGILSASAFYRHVRDVLFQSVSTVSDGRFDSEGIDRQGYRYSTTLNGGDGDLYGIEFAYVQQFRKLPAPLDGLGVEANVALIDGSFDDGTGRESAFPGTSNAVANGSLFYEKEGLSLRINYQWRDDFIDTFGFSGASNELRKGFGNLDFSGRYALSENIIGFLDVSNITNETYIAYLGQPDRPIEVERIGRSWLAGVRVVF